MLRGEFAQRASDPPKISVFDSVRVNSHTFMAKAPVSNPALKPPASYEAAQQELEQLVARLESGDMPLAQLLASYQRGAELLKFCRSQLEAVEEQIKVLDAGSLKAWTPE
jgi:exodeoxyribonuclease VII small subunit